MASSTLWAAIDPAAEWRVAPEGYSDGGADPSRQTVSSNVGPFNPKHNAFPFLGVLALTGLAWFIVFETGGVGAKSEAHIGPAKGSIGAEIEGKK